MSIINKLKEMGISLYDFAKFEERENYQNIESVNETLDLPNESLRLIYKKKK